jgi:drug/metabolite transporter (DMT)-like permease
MALVLFVNGLRFLLWGFIYRAHPVSNTYPLGSMIFPLILIVGHHWYDEPFTALKVIASLMIMAGVAILSTGDREDAENVAL